MDAWETILRSALPAGLTVAREGTQTDENRRMLAAFRWNLRVLSYVSLAVGAFLIFNTISVSVVRRRFEIGILRALGVTRGGILAGISGRSCGLGLWRRSAGIVLGRLMAMGAVQMVAATVESLYVSSQPGAIVLAWADAWIAIGDRRGRFGCLGVLACLGSFAGASGGSDGARPAGAYRPACIAAAI